MRKVEKKLNCPTQFWTDFSILTQVTANSFTFLLSAYANITLHVQKIWKCKQVSFPCKTTMIYHQDLQDIRVFFFYLSPPSLKHKQTYTEKHFVVLIQNEDFNTPAMAYEWEKKSNEMSKPNNEKISRLNKPETRQGNMFLEFWPDFLDNYHCGTRPSLCIQLETSISTKEVFAVKQLVWLIA